MLDGAAFTPCASDRSAGVEKDAAIAAITAGQALERLPVILRRTALRSWPLGPPSKLAHRNRTAGTE